MRKMLLCLLVLVAVPLCAAPPEPASSPSATVAVADVQGVEPVSLEWLATGSLEPVDATAVTCSGSCGGGRTWTWTCPAGWDCWLNCTKNPPAYCWKSTTGETRVGTNPTSTAVPVGDAVPVN